MTRLNLNGCSLGHDYVYYPMDTTPGATQPPCPMCKLATELVAAEATIIELQGVIDTMQAKLDKAAHE